VSGTVDANVLYEHLRTSDRAKVANALIVRKTADMTQLDAFAKMPRRKEDPMLLMFASKISVDEALSGIGRAGIAGKASLEEIRKAWPAGEIIVEDEGRRLMVVAAAERFSDQAMGITEKVVPDDAQRKLFDQAFGLIDRLLGRETK
jgi:hypothetical protein